MVKQSNFPYFFFKNCACRSKEYTLYSTVTFMLVIQKLILWFLRKYQYPTRGGSLEIPRGRGVLKGKIFQSNKPSVGGIWIHVFSGTTHFWPAIYIVLCCECRLMTCRSFCFMSVCHQETAAFVNTYFQSYYLSISDRVRTLYWLFLWSKN